VATDRAFWAWCVQCGGSANIGTSIVKTQAPHQLLWHHFQGASLGASYPWLKPWAMICSRFAANSDGFQG